MMQEGTSPGGLSPWWTVACFSRALHESGAHDRTGAVDPDQAQGLGPALRLTHHVRDPRGQEGMEHPPRRALLLFLRPPFVGPENGQKLLVSARSGSVNMLDLLSILV